MVENIVMSQRKIAWAIYISCLGVTLLIISSIIQPQIPGERIFSRRGVILPFRNITLATGDQRQEIELDILPLTNYSWALGFNVTTGLKATDKAAYVWMYHNVLEQDRELINIRLWISCLGQRPKYVEKPWDEKWVPGQVNNIKITLTQDSIVASTGDNHTASVEGCRWENWPSVREPFKMRLECFRFSGYCPTLEQKCFKGTGLSIFTLVINVMNYGCMGVILGMGLSVLWIRYLDVNIWQLAAVWGNGRLKRV
ncbi:hypothetical protein Pcinc_034990 [Petrolisthes cinctipes]|uniref:Uncharacterized protein n=1 Tax=Petrolisthes cinctipes TaxID=88211 RepID=A0AAE1BXP6_PETCI|nr:hypothetical protein Pcinc_034990 [Petrolisthes cinctipes]